MKTFGGFLGLEQDFATANKLSAVQENRLLLNFARCSLKVVLQNTKATKMFLPYFICDSVLAPIRELGVAFSFYSLNERLAPTTTPRLKERDLFLYVNYFGLCTKTVKDLYQRYSRQLVVDNSQSFFSVPHNNCWTFNSARKFFGVTDGSYLWSPQKLDAPKGEQPTSINFLKLKETNPKKAFTYYKKFEARITCKIAKASLHSKQTLETLNLRKIKRQRINNFKTLHKLLKTQNKFQIGIHSNEVPLCYPFWPKKKKSKDELIAKGLYLPKYWQEVETRAKGYRFEKTIAKDWLFLPIDQRYSQKDMTRIAALVNPF